MTHDYPLETFDFQSIHLSSYNISIHVLSTLARSPQLYFLPSHIDHLKGTDLDFFIIGHA